MLVNTSSLNGYNTKKSMILMIHLYLYLYVHVYSSEDYWSIVVALLALWVIYTCCAINPLTDYVLGWYVKTLIKATWTDLLRESYLFIKLGVSSLDICQSEFVCKINTAQQLDAEWRGDVCDSTVCQRNILVIDLRVSVYVFVEANETDFEIFDILLEDPINDYLSRHM